jgi:hypothetical protein
LELLSNIKKSTTEKRRKRTIYIDQEIDKQMRVAAVEDDKFYGQYAEEERRFGYSSIKGARKRSLREAIRNLENFANIVFIICNNSNHPNPDLMFQSYISSS